jgi:hypothetical protein
MTLISEPGNLIIILAASSALFAQSNGLEVQSQNHSTLPDVRQIVESSIRATERHWKTRLQYTYIERDEDRRLDSNGHVKSEVVEVSRTILINGVPFDQLVERNGRPPSSEDERKQREKLDELRRETPAQRAERVRREAEETASLVREVPKAFDFQLVGEDVVNGRPAYILQATPHPGYQPQGKYGKLFAKIGGKLWVDRQDFGWIKADAQVIQPFSIGLFLARVLAGSHITMEQTRIDGGIWMPEHIEMRAAAKIFFVKSLVIDRILTYSDYRLAGASTPMARGPVIP